MVFNEQSNEIKSSKIIFITGGTKSGKSEFAEFLGKKFSKITYIALSEQRPEDEHWQTKISVHRKRRPQDWKLIETNDLINILHREKGSILIDSIGGFIMENINLDDKKWSNRLQLLLELLQKSDNITLIVGEQVGLGLVSEYKIGNKYIERIGELQKNISQISEENWLTLNGRAIKLDNISFVIPT